jgi:LPXTG-motif cell wall-anchored protein
LVAATHGRSVYLYDFITQKGPAPAVVLPLPNSGDGRGPVPLALIGAAGFLLAVLGAGGVLRRRRHRADRGGAGTA